MLDTSLYSYLESIAMILFMERDKGEWFNSLCQSPHEKSVCVQDLEELVTGKIQNKVAMLPLRITFRGAAQGAGPLI